MATTGATTIAEYRAFLDRFEADPAEAALGPDPVFWLRGVERELRTNLWAEHVKAEARDLHVVADGMLRRLLAG